MRVCMTSESDVFSMSSRAIVNIVRYWEWKLLGIIVVGQWYYIIRILYHKVATGVHLVSNNVKARLAWDPLLSFSSKQSGSHLVTVRALGVGETNERACSPARWSLATSCVPGWVSGWVAGKTIVPNQRGSSASRHDTFDIALRVAWWECGLAVGWWCANHWTISRYTLLPRTTYDVTMLIGCWRIMLFP
jgi:hypothetical protein